MSRRAPVAGCACVVALLLPVGFAIGGKRHAAVSVPGASGCPIFPADNPWNTDVSVLPADPRSDTYIDSIGREGGMHPDFGSGLWEGGPIGIPYDVVGKGTRRSHVSFDYSDESDHARYPVPRKPHIEGGASSSGDRHIIMVDRGHCRLYELYDAHERGKRRWHAGSGAIWNLRSNKLRPAGWTSADAAGLPILPGLARYDEVAQGHIDHALRFTVERTQKAYVYPARHLASDSDDPSLPPMGLRLRLKQGFDTSGFPPQARVVLEALKKYGMIVADNGANWYVSGAPDSRWDNDDLHTLDEVKGSSFEVVDTGSLPTPGL